MAEGTLTTELTTPSWDYRQLLEQAPDAIILADREGIIRTWNAAATRLFGFPAHEAIGASLDLIVPPQHRAAHWVGFHAAIESGAFADPDPRPRRSRALTASGTILVDITAEVMRSAGGEVEGVIAIARAHDSEAG